MSRDAEEGFAAYKELYDKNISLVFLKEPHINTDTLQKSAGIWCADDRHECGIYSGRCQQISDGTGNGTDSARS